LLLSAHHSLKDVLVDGATSDLHGAVAQGGPRSFFSEIISSISDVRFSRDGRHMLSRDYMTVKLWDINMENRPIASFPVHEPLREKVLREYSPVCQRLNVAFAGCARPSPASAELCVAPGCTLMLLHHLMPMA